VHPTHLRYRARPATCVHGAARHHRRRRNYTGAVRDFDQSTRTRQRYRSARDHSRTRGSAPGQTCLSFFGRRNRIFLSVSRCRTAGRRTSRAAAQSHDLRRQSLQVWTVRDQLLLRPCRFKNSGAMGWESNLRLTRMADEFGIECMVPIGRWSEERPTTRAAASRPSYGPPACSLIRAT
jgi:hypothetical protein